MDRNKAIKNTELFLFDMDGTIYLGDKLFDFTAELLSEIKKQNKRYIFLTNNSSSSVNGCIGKLRRLGISACPDDFLTSSQATAYYLKKHYPEAVLYVCGTESLKDELKSNGFVLTDDLDKVTCVVMGYDTELTYKKLEDVCRILLSRDLPYIATNPDYVCPTEFGSVPDCGSICDMIYNATKKRPVVIGKPEPLMPLLAVEKTGVAPEKTAVVGDRIYTDVKCGLNAGLLSILVMSGETTEEILNSSADKPDVVLESGADILKIIKE